MKKILLTTSVVCAFVSTTAIAGVSSYAVDGKNLSIERIGFYLDPALSDALTEALKEAAADTNLSLGREAVTIESKMEAGIVADQDLVSTITLAPATRFEHPGDAVVGDAYWSGDEINEVDVELNSELAPDQNPEAARQALTKFLGALIKE